MRQKEFINLTPLGNSPSLNEAKKELAVDGHIYIQKQRENECVDACWYQLTLLHLRDAEPNPREGCYSQLGCGFLYHFII